MQGRTIENLALKINAFLVLLQTFHYQSFCSSGKIFFLGLPLAKVGYSIVVFKKYRDSIKDVATSARIQSARKYILSSNFDGQLPDILVICLSLCVRVLRVVAVA